MATDILMVPNGPRFDLRTSCRPSPALMLTLRASPRRYIGVGVVSRVPWGKVHSLWTRPSDSATEPRTFQCGPKVNAAMCAFDTQ